MIDDKDPENNEKSIPNYFDDPEEDDSDDEETENERLQKLVDARAKKLRD